MTLPQDASDEIKRLQSRMRAAVSEHWKAFLIEGILLAQPVQGVYTLTLVIGIYFVAEGVATIMYALEHRRELSERWLWLLIAGIFDLLISFMIISGLPGSAEWAIGLLVGINLVFGGSALIGMALAARPG